MQLTTANAGPYLVTRRLMHPDVIVGGDFMAIDSSRRNTNVKVRRRDGTGLFLKQTRTSEPNDVATLQREARCYQLPATHPALAGLARIMPSLRHYDAATRILTLDLIPNATSLQTGTRLGGTMPTEWAQALGDALATLHQADITAALDESAVQSIFPRTTPWILSIHEFNPEHMGTHTLAAHRQLFDLVKRYPGFADALAAARAGWSRDRLIHGDMKWDNCVVCLTENAAPRVIFTDWELADLGDPAWDVGALLQAWLSQWIGSIPHRPDATPAQLMASATTPLTAMQPAVQAFWTTYTSRRALAGEERSEFLLRATRAAAARLIQTAYESAAMTQQLDASTILLLQVSLNVLTRPAEAARQLLALAAP
jgi:aminoglycoside phosphotransferase (APT) family kinase protein